METSIELSNYIKENFPANARSLFSRKLIFGIGANDSGYMVKPITTEGRLCCPAYKQWFNMLSRCYSPASLKRRPTYADVTVCNEWHIFTEFRKWWIENSVHEWELDKDLLGGSKIYSPETCIYIPRWLNNFTTDSQASRGKFPIGVFFDKSKNKFTALCRNPITDKQVNLGGFLTPEVAHSVWERRKLELAFELKSKMDEIDARIYPRVVEIVRASL